MATSWSYVKTDRYKSVRELIHLLVDVVAKGGNLLLNIGPSPEGEWGADAYDRLKGIAAWMKVNSEAIYETRAIAPYKEGKVCLTKKKAREVVYAVYLPDKDENQPPRSILLQSLQPVPGAKVNLLGVDRDLSWKPDGSGVSIEVPEEVRQNPPCEHAWVIRISAVK
jgi:alpha-L-fucosidase